MSGNIKHSDEQGTAKKPRWRKKRWWVVGLFLTWYLHPLVWQIPGLWYLPLPLQCEYGDYDSAAIRKLVREARAMRGDYVMAVPYSTREYGQWDLTFPMDQFFQDFVSKANARDETLARIHAFYYALGAAVNFAKIQEKSDDPANVEKNTITVDARINLMNLGYIWPVPIKRTGHINVNIWHRVGAPWYNYTSDLDKRNQLTSSYEKYENKLLSNQSGRLARVTLEPWSYWPFGAGRTSTWGIVNECFDASRLPEDFRIIQQNLTEALGLTPETRGFKVYATDPSTGSG